MRDARMRRTAAGGLGLFAVYLAAAVLMHDTVVPWEVAVALLPVGCLLLWRVAGQQPLGLLFGRQGLPVRVLVIAGLVAAGYGAAMAGIALLLGVRVAAPVAGLGVIVVSAALIAPLVGGVLNALPEEVVFRGFYLRTFTAAAGSRVGLAVSALLFAAAHAPNAVLAWQLSGVVLGLRLVELAGFGLLMGWAALRTGTVWLPVAWHAGSNYSSILIATMTETTDELAFHVWGVGALTGEALLLWAVLRRIAQRRSADGSSADGKSRRSAKPEEGR